MHILLLIFFVIHSVSILVSANQVVLPLSPNVGNVQATSDLDLNLAAHQPGAVPAPSSPSAVDTSSSSQSLDPNTPQFDIKQVFEHGVPPSGASARLQSLSDSNLPVEKHKTQIASRSQQQPSSDGLDYYRARLARHARQEFTLTSSRPGTILPQANSRRKTKRSPVDQLEHPDDRLRLQYSKGIGRDAPSSLLHYALRPRPNEPPRPLNPLPSIPNQPPSLVPPPPLPDRPQTVPGMEDYPWLRRPPRDRLSKPQPPNSAAIVNPFRNIRETQDQSLSTYGRSGSLEPKTPPDPYANCGSPQRESSSDSRISSSVLTIDPLANFRDNQDQTLGIYGQNRPIEPKSKAEHAPSSFGYREQRHVSNLQKLNQSLAKESSVPIRGDESRNHPRNPQNPQSVQALPAEVYMSNIRAPFQQRKPPTDLKQPSVQPRGSRIFDLPVGQVDDGIANKSPIDDWLTQSKLSDAQRGAIASTWNRPKSSTDTVLKLPRPLTETNKAFLTKRSSPSRSGSSQNSNAGDDGVEYERVDGTEFRMSAPEFESLATNLHPPAYEVHDDSARQRWDRDTLENRQHSEDIPVDRNNQSVGNDAFVNNNQPPEGAQILHTIPPGIERLVSVQNPKVAQQHAHSQTSNILKEDRSFHSHGQTNLHAKSPADGPGHRRRENGSRVPRTRPASPSASAYPPLERHGLGSFAPSPRYPISHGLEDNVSQIRDTRQELRYRKAKKRQQFAKLHDSRSIATRSKSNSILPNVQEDNSRLHDSHPDNINRAGRILNYGTIAIPHHIDSFGHSSMSVDLPTSNTALGTRGHESPAVSRPHSRQSTLVIPPASEKAFSPQGSEPPAISCPDSRATTLVKPPASKKFQCIPDNVSPGVCRPDSQGSTLVRPSPAFTRGFLQRRNSRPLNRPTYVNPPSPNRPHSSHGELVDPIDPPPVPQVNGPQNTPLTNGHIIPTAPQASGQAAPNVSTINGHVQFRTPQARGSPMTFTGSWSIPPPANEANDPSSIPTNGHVPSIARQGTGQAGSNPPLTNGHVPSTARQGTGQAGSNPPLTNGHVPSTARQGTGQAGSNPPLTNGHILSTVSRGLAFPRPPAAFDLPFRGSNNPHRAQHGGETPEHLEDSDDSDEYFRDLYDPTVAPHGNGPTTPNISPAAGQSLGHLNAPLHGSNNPFRRLQGHGPAVPNFPPINVQVPPTRPQSHGLPTLPRRPASLDLPSLGYESLFRAQQGHELATHNSPPTNHHDPPALPQANRPAAPNIPSTLSDSSEQHDQSASGPGSLQRRMTKYPPRVNFNIPLKPDRLQNNNNLFNVFNNPPATPHTRVSTAQRGNEPAAPNIASTTAQDTEPPTPPADLSNPENEKPKSKIASSDLANILMVPNLRQPKGTPPQPAQSQDSGPEAQAQESATKQGIPAKPLESHPHSIQWRSALSARALVPKYKPGLFNRLGYHTSYRTFNNGNLPGHPRHPRIPYRPPHFLLPSTTLVSSSKPSPATSGSPPLCSRNVETG